jgi:hypothetical protein
MQVRTLTHDRVAEYVPPEKPGFYRLGSESEAGFKRGYFGRSDTDLRIRLFTHARRNEFDQFVARVTDTAEVACYLECREWHLPAGSTRNSRHPQRVDGWTCPFCKLSDHVESASTGLIQKQTER